MFNQKVISASFDVQQCYQCVLIHQNLQPTLPTMHLYYFVRIWTETSAPLIPLVCALLQGNLYHTFCHRWTTELIGQWVCDVMMMFHLCFQVTSRFPAWQRTERLKLLSTSSWTLWDTSWSPGASECPPSCPPHTRQVTSINQSINQSLLKDQCQWESPKADMFSCLLCLCGGPRQLSASDCVVLLWDQLIFFYTYFTQ